MTQDAKHKDRAPNAAINSQLPHDFELDERSVEALRQKLAKAPRATRDKLCEDLQYRAERAPLIKGEGHALLVAMPIVLGYSRKTKLKGQDALARESASALAEVLRTLWAKAIPGCQIAPLLTALRLDLALAARPSEVQACARTGADLLFKNQPGRHAWRVEGSQPSEVMPPIPGVMLALAAVKCSPGHGPMVDRGGLERTLQDFATVVGAVFSTVQEVPSVTVGAPLPFYSATERAFSGQLQYLAGRGGPASRIDGAEPVQVEVMPVKRGQAARVVLTAASELSEGYGEPLCSWDSDWSWRTAESLVRASEHAGVGSHDDDYWVSVRGQFLGGLHH